MCRVAHFALEVCPRFMGRLPASCSCVCAFCRWRPASFIDGDELGENRFTFPTCWGHDSSRWCLAVKKLAGRGVVIFMATLKLPLPGVGRRRRRGGQLDGRERADREQAARPCSKGRARAASGPCRHHHGRLTRGGCRRRGCRPCLGSSHRAPWQDSKGRVETSARTSLTGALRNAHASRRTLKKREHWG